MSHPKHYELGDSQQRAVDSLRQYRLTLAAAMGGDQHALAQMPVHYSVAGVELTNALLITMRKLLVESREQTKWLETIAAQLQLATPADDAPDAWSEEDEAEAKEVIG